MKQELIEGIDFYYHENGLMVLTEKYHLDRGYCCGNGCRHCPYEYQNVPEPRKKELLESRVRSRESGVNPNI
ncbi:MAG: hypothetical protein C5B59_13190 [Bacteroidetes bacterium]|nr:MAG: hypothetical protein C5B59_13190 [Bacteroidota bacterium]